MKRLLPFLALLLLVSCNPWWDVEDDYDPTFPEIPSFGFTSPLEIGQWLNRNVRYYGDEIHDKIEYWQSPDQTYIWRAGDCEDFAVLMMYMLHVELGGWPSLVMGYYYGGYHGWVLYEGQWFEAQTGRDVTNDVHYVLDETVTYGITMWRSMNTHKVLKGDER
jgi:hypothetical protein